MNKSTRFLSIITFIALAFLLMNVMGKTNIKTIKNVSEKYEIKAVKIPSYLELAGERVPIEKPDIRERMDRELLVNTYWQSNGLLMIKRANKYFPIIEPLLAEYGIPDDFKYLAVAESGLLVNNSSHARASGLWHFLPRTAREKKFKLEVNKNVDERYHIQKSTKAAAIYLKHAKKIFGAWTLAAAAYNAGVGRVSERLKAQNVTSYYDARLPDETERYVFRILALKEIMSNPEKYGFVYDQKDLYTYPDTYEVEVNTPIPNLAAFAKKHGVTYKDLKLVNPWLRETKLNNASGKKYFIKIPQ